MGDEQPRHEPGSAPANTRGTTGGATPPRLTETISDAAPPRLTEHVGPDVAPPAGTQPVAEIAPDTETAADRGAVTSVAEQLLLSRSGSLAIILRGR